MVMEKYQCCACRRILTEHDFYQSSSEKISEGIIPYCKDCMTKIYKKYVEELNISVFDAACMCCVKFDVAAFDSIIKTLKKDSTEWVRYMDEMVKRKKKIDPFGVKGSVKFWIGKAEAAMQKMKANDIPKEKMEEWKEFWGDDFEGRQCTVDDYNGFDKIYNSLLESRQILNADDLFTLRRVSKMMYRIEKLILKTDDKSILMAKNLQDIVNKTMESSLLRKKDMGEQAAFRLDDMVKALERRNVKFFTLKEVQEKLALFHPAHLHPLDLADQALEKIMNCVVGNSGLADYAVIPDEFQPDAFDGNA